MEENTSLNNLERVPFFVQDIINNKYKIVFLSEETTNDVVVSKKYELKKENEFVGTIITNFISKNTELDSKKEADDFSTILTPKRENFIELRIEIHFKENEFILEEKNYPKQLRLVSEAILKQTDPDYFKPNEFKE